MFHIVYHIYDKQFRLFIFNGNFSSPHRFLQRQTKPLPVIMSSKLLFDVFVCCFALKEYEKTGSFIMLQEVDDTSEVRGHVTMLNTLKHYQVGVGRNNVKVDLLYLIYLLSYRASWSESNHCDILTTTHVSQPHRCLHCKYYTVYSLKQIQLLHLQCFIWN